MSFDLAIWHQAAPLTDEEAFAIYDRLTDGFVGVVQESPAVQKFLSDLLEIYPEDTDESDPSPWASGIYSNSECVLLAISWSRKEEVSTVVEGLAVRRGLVVYDPQSGVLKRSTQ
ncbi:hypothetical protein AB0F72_35085 [Actinoplanes sp. NPDC023936]|uniref:hypothetical protein n=1 Tax=Actinoplanes sp. NPDC023936 TaxID=3154910 RepID=UPI0033DF0B47